MISSRRDYLVRLIEEAGKMLSRAVFHRKGRREQEALLSVVQGCEILFGMEGHQLFQFTADQHYAMLTRDVPEAEAHARTLLYAALNTEAGRCYTALDKPDLARVSFLAALRFTLKAQADYPAGIPPTYAPNVAELQDALKGQPLDAEVDGLLRSVGTTT